MAKRILGYRVGRTQPDRNGHHALTIQVYSFAQRDYVKEMTQWTHNAESCEYYRRMAHILKGAYGKPIGLDAESRDSVELAWLGYRYKDDSDARWIAPKIDTAYLDVHSISLLKMLLPAFNEAGKETQPEDFIAYLASKGAILVRYHNEASCFVPDTASDVAAYLETETIKA
jgi:hypothetical protein